MHKKNCIVRSENFSGGELRRLAHAFISKLFQMDDHIFFTLQAPAKGLRIPIDILFRYHEEHSLKRRDIEPIEIVRVKEIYHVFPVQVLRRPREHGKAAAGSKTINENEIPL